MVKRPMKAPSEPITEAQLDQIGYPVYVSPKLDGIRAVTDGKQVLSNTLKPIGNKYIQQCLKGEDYDGFDGELVVGLPYCEHEEDDVFNRTTGPVRRSDGKPNFKFYVFDDFRFPKETYDKRWIQQINECEEIEDIPFIEILEQRLCHNKQDVLDAEAEFVAMGYEGSMVRRGSAPYKEGRATIREEYIFKRKPIEDDEAIILSCFEQEENLNEQVKDELGLSKRSSHKENKVGKDTLGGFVCKSLKYGWEFNCGTIIGGTLAFRKEWWERWKNDPESVKGLTIKYKFQKVGSLEKPRQPIMKGFRDPSDITDY